MRTPSRSFLIAATLTSLFLAPCWVEAAPPQQTVPPPGGVQLPAPQPSPAPVETKFWPLTVAGWTYNSLLGNTFTGGVILAPGHSKGKDMAIWRGPQVTGSYGTKGFEVGGGYAKMTIATQFPIGYGFRGVGGQVRERTNGLDAGQWYAGGEATATFMVFRISGGLVVPVGNGTRSHTPVLIGSVGMVWPFTNFWAMKR